MSVKTYLKSKDGNTKLTANFKVSEFACKDGSDKILIDTQLVAVLQYIREALDKPVNLNSAYRTPEYNKKIGGATQSQHMLGTAADVSVAGVDTVTVCKAAEKALAKFGITGAIIRYTLKSNPNNYFTHIDVRASRLRQENRDGTAVNVSGWAENASQAATTRPTLKKGDKGADVATLQGLLGIKADGDFGANTDAAVKAFQKSKGLTADGIVGAKTWTALGL